MQVTLGFTPVEPNDGLQVLLLFGGEIVDLARDLAVYIARVDHPHFVFMRFEFVTVKKPQFAGHGASIEKIGADGDP